MQSPTLLHYACALAALAAAACSRPAPQEPSARPVEHTAAAPDPAPPAAAGGVERRTDGWHVTATRSCGEATADGVAIVDGAEAPSGQALAVARTLASSRAVVESARERWAAGDLETARRCAESALAALGDDYAPRGVMDDTGLHLLLADDLIQRGKTRDGVDEKIDMLAVRAQLLAVRHGMR